MDINLSSCPFCGGEGRLLHIQKIKVDGSIVKCEVCGSTGEFFPINVAYSSDEKAITAWNTRI